MKWYDIHCNALQKSKELFQPNLSHPRSHVRDFSLIQRNAESLIVASYDTFPKKIKNPIGSCLSPEPPDVRKQNHAEQKSVLRTSAYKNSSFGISFPLGPRRWRSRSSLACHIASARLFFARSPFFCLFFRRHPVASGYYSI